jgi:hypothetical protein
MTISSSTIPLSSTAVGIIWLLVHALAMVVFVNRYFGGFVMRMIRGAAWDEVDDAFVPTVTVIIPLFNEGASL